MLHDMRVTSKCKLGVYLKVTLSEMLSQTLPTSGERTEQRLLILEVPIDAALQKLARLVVTSSRIVA